MTAFEISVLSAGRSTLSTSKTARWHSTFTTAHAAESKVEAVTMNRVKWSCARICGCRKGGRIPTWRRRSSGLLREQVPEAEIP